MRLRVIAHEGRQAGTAAVELALLLPLVAFMMFLVAESGRALYQYNTLNKSVRDAAQYLARYGMHIGTGVLAPTSAQETRARNLAVYGSPVAGTTPLLPGLKASNVAITYQRLYGSGADNAVTVTATYAYQPLFGVLASGFTQGSPLGAKQMVASIRMRGV